MAAALQIGILNYFSVIFPTLLVFVILFAILEKTKILGDNKVLNATAAIAASFIVMLSKNIIAIISVGAPWFVLVFVFLTLLLLIYRFMGASEANLANVITKDKAVIWALLAIGLIIVISSISNIYGQRLLDEDEVGGDGKVTVTNTTGGDEVSYKGELRDTIFNTKVIGLMFIFLVAVFTISLLTRSSV